MATQRVTIAKIGGRAAYAIEKSFRRWHEELIRQNDDDHVCEEVDAFAAQLRMHAHQPPVVYFTEWIDMWSMGDVLHELGNASAIVVSGKQYEASIHSQPATVKKYPNANQELSWLRHRLKEANDAWRGVVDEAVIVVLRQPLGLLVEDGEISESLTEVPQWLAEVLVSNK